MLGIGVLAGAFAVFGVTDVVAILGVASILSLPIVWAAPGRKLRAAAFVSSLYPVWLLLSVYATWFTAWVALGHRPRSSLDDPKFISPFVLVPWASTWLLILGVYIALPFCVFLTIACIAQNVRREDSRPPSIATLILVPIISWLSLYAILHYGAFKCDYILEWFFDWRKEHATQCSIGPPLGLK
jgi:hypothetical protein